MVGNRVAQFIVDFPRFIQDEYDTMEESPLFREDWLGLAELKRSQRLILKQIEGNHVEFPENFVQDELLQYLQ